MTTLNTLLKLQATMPGSPDIDHPKPERLIAGNPRRETWNLVDVPVAGRLYCGVWRCEPGHWRIAMGHGEHELFTVLEGRCVLRGDDGSERAAGPGEAIYIPAGFAGSFEVVEAITKTYAIIEG